MKKRLLLLTSIFSIAVNAWALMPYYAGARAIGMGEAFTSLANDNSALYYNPAGLADMEKNEITAMYWRDYFTTGYSFLSYGMPFENWGGLSLGWAKTSNTFEKTDPWGSVVGDADISNDVFMLGAGYYRGLPFPLGFTAKFITEKIDTFAVSGWAVDFGSFVEVKPIRIGVSLQNAVSGGLNGDSLAGGTVSEKIPSSLRFGISLTTENTFSMEAEEAQECDEKREEAPEKLRLKFTFATDVVVPSNKPEDYRLSPGAELWFDNSIGVRAGCSELRDYTAGLSLKLNFIRIDYAFIISKELENSHILSTSIFF